MIITSWKYRLRENWKGTLSSLIFRARGQVSTVRLTTPRSHAFDQRERPLCSSADLDDILEQKKHNIRTEQNGKKKPKNEGRELSILE